MDSNKSFVPTKRKMGKIKNTKKKSKRFSKKKGIILDGSNYDLIIKFKGKLDFCLQDHISKLIINSKKPIRKRRRSLMSKWENARLI